MTTKINSVNGTIIQNTCRYEWKITNFDCCKTFGEFLVSPKFISHNGEFKWRLQLYPHSNDKEHEGYISLFLESLNPLDIKIKARLVIDSYDYDTITRKLTSEIEAGSARGYAKFCKRKTNTDPTQLLNNNLSVYCEFLDTGPIDFLKFREKTKVKTLYNIGRSVFTDDFHDVTIKVGEKQFKGHKAVLAAASDVFEAMFRNEMIEKKTNVVEIENIDPEIFELLIHFIYTGEIYETNSYKTLLVAADRYNIDRLKNLCAHKLSQSISINNVVELLKLAETYNVKILKDSAIDFIVNNAKNIINQPVFNDLKTVSFDSVLELFRRQNSS